MFENLKQLPIDPIFGVLQKFMDDPNPEKINLSIGIYTDTKGKPFVFPSVRKAVKKLQTKNFNYLSMKGCDKFLRNTEKLFLGKSVAAQRLFAAQQTCGGTHACKLFSDLIKRDFGTTKILVGVPTWDNYFQLFGDHEIVKFYHLNKNREVNFNEYENQILKTKDNSVLILQGGDTHNPTGKNLEISDLEKLIPIIKQKNIFMFVDFAYFGFGKGFDEDQKFLKFLVENLDDLALGVSFSKNASLYRHRMGALFVKAKGDQQKTILEENLQNLVRGSVSNMPAFGAEIMNEIFENNFEQWKREVDQVREDINNRRKLLLEKLPERFSHLKDTVGMFGISGLSLEQVLELRKKRSVYMPDNGRINFAGIKLNEIEKIAEAFIYCG